MRRQIGVGDLRLTEREKRCVNQVLESNRLSYGPFSKRFEAEFAHDCRYAVFCNSGTSALHVALAREVAGGDFYIGCHPGMTQSDLDWVIERFHASSPGNLCLP